MVYPYGYKRRSQNKINVLDTKRISSDLKEVDLLLTIKRGIVMSAYNASMRLSFKATLM